MNNSTKICLGGLFAAFLLSPGIMHYIREHEAMKYALKKDQAIISHFQKNSIKNTGGSTEELSYKKNDLRVQLSAKIKDIGKFCLRSA